MPGGEKLKKKKAKSQTGRISLPVKVHRPEAEKTSNGHSDRLSGKKAGKAGESKKPLAIGEKRGEKQAWTEDKKTEQKEFLKEIIKTAEETEIINERLAAKVEQQKKIIMWSGVVFFMLLIASVWAYNVRQTLKLTQSDSGSEISDLDFGQIGDELSVKMKELKENLAAVKNFTDNASDSSATSTQETEAATSTINGLPADSLPDEAAGAGATTTAADEAEELSELRKKLEELEKKLEKK